MKRLLTIAMAMGLFLAWLRQSQHTLEAPAVRLGRRGEFSGPMTSSTRVQ